MNRLAAAAMCLAACAYDPSPGLSHTRQEARNFECHRLTQIEGHERYPGDIPSVPPRQLAAAITEALVCEPRFIPLQDRAPRDEAILSTLRRDVGALTQLASTLNPGPFIWHVDAFYPEQAIASKISIAAKTELFERGRSVSDRVPTLAAGDISVLSRLPPNQAYATACKRYFSEHVLGEHDVFLGLMVIDPRETQLHAGVCQAGVWRWVQ